MKNVVICGYHGFANSGDEALLRSMIDVIRSKCSDIHITVLSKCPEQTEKSYDVDSVYRYNLFKINKLFKSTDLFLFGGGSLIQDITSSRSLYYYLTILKLAQINHVKIMVYGNGIGPLCRERNRKISGRCLNKVDLITLRDEKSKEILTQIGVKNPQIIVTADPAFTLKSDAEVDVKKIFEYSNVPYDIDYAVLAIRPWDRLSSDFTEKLAALCDRMNEKYHVVPVFVLMQYDKDKAIAKDTISRMKTKGYILEQPLNVDEIFAIVGHAVLAVGMRLHTLIYAVNQGVPIMALSYDPKVEDFMHSIKQPFYVNVEEGNEQEFSRQLDLLMGNLTENREKLKGFLTELRANAERNADLAVDLLKYK